MGPAVNQIFVKSLFLFLALNSQVVRGSQLEVKEFQLKISTTDLKGDYLNSYNDSSESTIKVTLTPADIKYGQQYCKNTENLAGVLYGSGGKSYEYENRSTSVGVGVAKCTYSSGVIFYTMAPSIYRGPESANKLGDRYVSSASSFFKFEKWKSDVEFETTVFFGHDDCSFPLKMGTLEIHLKE